MKAKRKTEKEEHGRRRIFQNPICFVFSVIYTPNYVFRIRKMQKGGIRGRAIGK